jgi:SGNH hydrolase-like domain, acetyltransferase AlgX
MRSVQDKLARRGIPFLLVIAPSKVEVYPEHVPSASFGGRLPNQITTNYERYRPDFIAAGINLYDGPRIFLEWKQAGQRNLFARAGTHWSYLSALQVLREVRERLNPQMRHPLPPLVVEKQLSKSAQFVDADLINLLNLLFDFPFNHDQPFPVLVRQKEVQPDQLPRILWVHDSFGWPLIELLYNANAMQRAESLYYFENLYRFRGGIKAETDIHQLDWEVFLQKHDAVVMVWTEIAFESLGWGFFETMDEQLK